LAIDWATTPMTTDAEANAVWARIAPTGADWEAKLYEVPVAYSRPLAVALLHGGNFVCPVPPPPPDCPRELEIPEPAPSSGMTDPCLRRLLALWAIGQLDDDDIPNVFDSLKSIAAIPMPETQLVAAAIESVTEDDHARRLELIAIAHKAGNKDVAGSKVGMLDEAHLIDAVKKHHVHAALQVLSAEGHRSVYLTAITDEAMDPRARSQAITELVEGVPKLAPDATKALVTATKAKDCLVAATAARELALRGDTRFLPRRPKSRSPEAMMRALCVLASYEVLQGADETSLLTTFVPAKGLELEIVHFDPLSEVDTDGDGDPRTHRELTLVPHEQVAMASAEDMVRAFRNCQKTTCTSHDLQFRFHLKPGAGGLQLARLEIAELPSCPIQ
ncbi:MAG: hypothetical protein H6Q90_7098, partial [Deltaproteobacteria bacterium]|nr:hypothetical protein [Deltaproteobacteria bacterium]